jgi:hypothetical protein
MGQWPTEATPAEAPQQQAQHPAMPAGRSASRSARATNTRRTLSLVIVVPALVVAIPVLRVLLDAGFGSSRSASGVISSVLMLLGLPLGARGLYGLATGAARIVDAPSPHAWLRPPVAYLTVALVLFVAAGLAAT